MSGRAMLATATAIAAPSSLPRWPPPPPSRPTPSAMPAPGSPSTRSPRRPRAPSAAASLIGRLVAAGDRAGALVVYEDLRERLRTTLGIAPSSPTRELAASIRKPARDRPSSSPLLDRRTTGAFVGRDAERAAAARTTGLVVVAGDAGVGKTRLALELARGVRDAGGVALVGRCSEEPVRPYEAWTEALRPVADDDALARLYDEDDRFVFFEAVRALLAGIAEAWPVIVVLDDLQWADRPTLLLLAHLVRAPEGPPARLVGTYRSTELDRGHPLGGLLADTRREHLAERISLRAWAPRRPPSSSPPARGWIP